jgi:hypothetical protein
MKFWIANPPEEQQRQAEFNSISRFALFMSRKNINFVL